MPWNLDTSDDYPSMTEGHVGASARSQADLPNMWSGSVVVRWILLPGIVYFVSFCLLTFPLITTFPTNLWADSVDGLQNLWNMWWIDRAVTLDHTSFWFTTYLHYPNGTSLLGSTLNPFNGLIGIILHRFLTPFQAYDVMFTSAFVLSGMTAMWLAYWFTESYFGSMLGGFLFTFSSFHWDHSYGHLPVLSMEWVPLFLLLAFQVLKRPNVMTGALAGIALCLVMLCDYYFFMYCLMAVGLALLWCSIQARRISVSDLRPYVLPLGVFATVTLLLVGPVFLSLYQLNQRDPLQGAHSPALFSLDVPSLIIPGLNWRFANWTTGYWHHLASVENYVYIGVPLLLLVVFGARRRKGWTQDGGIWVVIILIFAVLSVGPSLHVWGETVPAVRGASFLRSPYWLLENLLPPLRLSGVPSRMMMMVTLATTVIAAAAFKAMRGAPRSSKIVVTGLFLLAIVGSVPGTLESNLFPPPGYVEVLRNLPDHAAIVDMVDGPGEALYYQTLHRRPMAFGYMARIPRSVAQREGLVTSLVRDHRFDVLSHNFGYVLLPAKATVRGQAVVYRDKDVVVYRLSVR